jgi:MFS family permease
MFAALKYPNFRLWFYGQLVSLFGTWMQTTAQGFLVFELTRSSSYLGYVGFAAGIPSWLFTLMGGVVADRVSRRSLMMVTQTCMMLLAFVLAGLTFSGMVQPWHILILAFLLGTANSFDAPARQAFVSEMVPRGDLTNAIALNSTMFNTATAVGPATAGITYALLGPGWCFVINGISFIAVIVALQRMKLSPSTPQKQQASALESLKEGFRFVRTHQIIRVVISMIAVTSLFILALTSLIPAWAVKVLGGDATTNGLLISSRGIGAVIGALIIASLGRIAYRGRLLSAGSLIYPLLLILFTFTRWLPLSMLCLAGVGVGSILVMNLSNALVQTSTPDHLRGRVMGAYTWIFFGCMPLGALWLGKMADLVGEPEAVLINALLALVFFVVVRVFFPKLLQQ